MIDTLVHVGHLGIVLTGDEPIEMSTEVNSLGRITAVVTVGGVSIASGETGALGALGLALCQAENFVPACQPAEVRPWIA